MEPTEKNIANLKSLLDFIENILSATQGKDEFDWFIQDFGARFSKYFLPNDQGLPHISAEGLGQIGVNVDWIISYLRINIPVNKLIDFSFIGEQFDRARKQLEIDNVQMWRARYGKNNEDGCPDFEEFCRFAHYQLEEILSLYFYIFEKYKPDELKEQWLNSVATVNIHKDDECYYRGDIFESYGKKVIYYNKLSESGALRHKTKYRTKALENYLPYGTSSKVNYSLKRKFFIQLHNYNEPNWEKKILNFKYAEYISWYRNELSHRSSMIEEKEYVSDEKKHEYLSFKSLKDFNTISLCIEECIGKVKEELPNLMKIEEPVLS
ncbi:hypothetical protein ACFSRY_10060 [Pontibacter locisalis]|uniref:Abi-like protein n=1 Tax=Pontibacter locisalis TaxID=1719035 RepID=A0ABW5IKQ2_9BACT